MFGGELIVQMCYVVFAVLPRHRLSSVYSAVPVLDRARLCLALHAHVLVRRHYTYTYLVLRA